MVYHGGTTAVQSHGHDRWGHGRWDHGRWVMVGGLGREVF